MKDIVMKRVSVLGQAVVVGLVLSASVASAAAANPPLACYKAVHDEFGVTGNYKDAACTEKTAVLKGEYVLAEPTEPRKEDLWCAKLTPVVGPPGTGLYENATCTQKKENGEYTEVVVLELSVNQLIEAGRALPVVLQSEAKSNVIRSELRNSAGGLFGEGLLLNITVTNLDNTSETSYLVLFLNVREKPEPKNTCKTAAL